MQFSALYNLLGCNRIPITVKSHGSLIAERFHDPLRRITQKLRVDHPHAPLSLISDHTSLAMSHKLRPEGCTPAILIFGPQFRLPIGNYEQQSQIITNIMDPMQIARQEYESLVAKLLIRPAFH